MKTTIESHPGKPDVSNAKPSGLTISGFWRRVLALILDGLALGILGFVFGLFLFDFFAHLGGWGRLLGFCVALVYFAVLNSSLGKGQTIGKRIMKIEVVNRDGAHISLARSAVRYMVLGTPFFLNNAILPPYLVISPIGYIMVFIVFGIGGSIVYLYIFNRRTRQSLHDLLLGTFVVHKTPRGSLQTSAIWTPHFIVVGAWLLIVISFAFLIPHLIPKNKFSELFAIQQSIYSSGKVHTAKVSVGKTRIRTIGGEKRETAHFGINAIWKERPVDYEAAGKQIAGIIFNEYPDIIQKDMITITVTYGYDIGIARAWKSQTISHSPQEWQQILGLSRSEL